MNKKYKYTISLLLIFVLSGCSDLLDRPTLTRVVDDNFWRNESDLELYANGFYDEYFVGYNDGWGTDFAPVRSTTFSDDFVSEGTQSNFENSVPTSRGTSSESRSSMDQYYGPNWGFGRVRKANIFIDRIENVAKEKISEEAYQHWLSVAYFFKAYEYADLVNVFGDVPYFATTVSDAEPDVMYKDRDKRGVVMDEVYDMFAYVLDNMRLDDGEQRLNRYIAAGFITRFMLYEGTWQKYHSNDATRAKKYLELSVRAGDLVINSNKWSFGKDYKSIFTSFDLAGHPEVLMHRTYDSALGIMHHIGAYNSGRESQTGVNLEYIKSFLCNDGKPYSTSGVAGANDFSIENLTLTRDPRFDANFVARPHNQSSSMIYSYKYASRESLDYYFSSGGDLLPEWYSQFNISDAPIMRLGEIVLNWIEAKAELATMGGAAVTQADIDASINAIRSRPLDAVATDKGIQKTAPMSLANLPDDPDRDTDVPPLLWEIRRERRMEFVFEHSRLLDIKRWKKLSYMDVTTNPDLHLGLWIDFPNEYAEWLVPAMEGKLKVQNGDGVVITYNGTNAAEIVGYYIPENIVTRDAFTDRVYLAPVGITQIAQYSEKGYTLTQTPGW